jgi:membrane protein
MFVSPTLRAGLKGFGALLVTAFKEWVRDRCAMMAAAMSYHLMLSIAPFIGIAVWLESRIFGSQWTQETIYPLLVAWYGPRWADLLRYLLSRTAGPEARHLFQIGVLAAFGMIVGTVGFFLQVRHALETIWDVRREVALVSVQFRKHVLALGHAAVCAIIAFAGMSIGAEIVAISRSTRSPAAAAGILWIGGGIAAFGTFWALMLFLLKVLPPVRLTWRQTMPWAALAAAMHLAGVQVLHWIIRHDPATSLVESLVAMLLWFFYASALFLYGAELMHVWIQRHGTTVTK